MENIDFTATLELVAGIAIVAGIAATFFKKTSAVPGETVDQAPYKVETPPATTVVEETPAPVVEEKPKTRARKDSAEKKPAVKKVPAKKTAKKKASV